VVAIDPVGTMHGLAHLADGTPSNLGVVIFGGDHANVDIEETQGAAVAMVVVRENVNAVIDVSPWSNAARRRFMTTFSETFNQEIKRKQHPITLVIDEAQLFLPQNPPKGDERMVGALTYYVRLGRNFRGGCILITQRPQSVTKEALNQCEVLILGQLTGPHERKAIEAWVVENVADVAGARQWLRELVSLPVGTAMVWSPQWLKVFEKVKISKKTTLDTGSGSVKVSTPSVGNIVLTAKLTERDIAEVVGEIVNPASEELVRLLAHEIGEPLTARFQKERRIAYVLHLFDTNGGGAIGTIANVSRESKIAIVERWLSFVKAGN
jgi:hypothetical protein